ncbi:MAG: hypothetical protein ACP5I6_00745 [Caldisphaera sp.]|jgi:hypothetical protein|nr:hypothetical protein [Caldisphaera sp.]PMP61083.1 MAG: hypothetical protein C0201_00845 [Caldisphaera sp.]
MSKKFQTYTKTNGSIILAIINKVILSIENSFDESYNLFDAKVEKNLIEENSLRQLIKNKRIELKVDVPWEFDTIEDEANNMEIKIIKDKYLKNFVSIKDLYSFVPLIPYKFDLEIIKNFSRKTTESNIEYLMLYDYNSNLTILEGELLRVKIPFVKVIYNMHTHPYGHCGLSQQDINSGLDLLSEGGLSTSASTENCAVAMFRQGLVIENDYIKIKELKGNIDENLSSIKFEKILY